MLVAITVLIISVLLSLCLFYIKRKFSYWARQKIPFVKPHFPHGNFGEVGRKSLADLSNEQYIQMKDKGRFFGLFFYLQPLVMITDLELIKTILINDFNYFPDRGAYHNPRDDPISAHLFAIEGNYWRSLRTRLTPTFTSGKMKLMFPTVKAVADHFSAFLENSVADGSELEVKDCTARFTSDVIGSCAFGIDCNSFAELENSERKFDWRMFTRFRYSITVRLFLRLFPGLGQLLRMKAISDEVNHFLSNLVRTTIEYREKHSIDRKDFMSLLIELKKSELSLSVDEIAAQSFIFFFAGFETSSSNQTYCLYELALNQELQEKARSCVLNGIKKHGGLTYEAISDMHYLDQCIKETLRLYPPVTVLERKAFQDYRIPDSQVIIPKGMKVHIPVFAIQRDEQYYPNPNVFDPDRFHSDEVAKRHICTFLPFGEGPRICIGLRFATMQSRVGLATVLSKFRVTPCSRTAIPLEYSAKFMLLQPKENLWLKFEPL